MINTAKKRFSEDVLRQSYQYYADLFGESKKTVKTAIDRLEELDVVKRNFRTVAYGDGLISNNVMYIELIPSRVYELTYPEKNPCMDKKIKPCLEGAGDKMRGSLPTKSDTPPSHLGDTYTENTSKNTNRDYINHINQSMQNDVIEQIKENTRFLWGLLGVPECLVAFS